MSRLKLGVLISGGGTNLQAIIDNIQSGYLNAEISLVISNRQDAYGLIRGEKAGIETLFINPKDQENDRQYNDQIIKELKKRDVQLVVLAGYLKVLSNDFVESFRNRIINIHPSLIPSFCGKNCYGLKVHEQVLDYGVKYTGATVHLVDEGTDTGPIIIQEVVKVEDDDTPEILQKRVLEVEHKILIEAIKLFSEDRLKIEGRKVRTL